MILNNQSHANEYVSIISEQSERIEGPVQCYRCGEIFESMELVKEHQTEKYKVFRKSAYGKERPIQCHVCKYMFESEEKKSYHMCRSVGLLSFCFGVGLNRIGAYEFPDRTGPDTQMSDQTESGLRFLTFSHCYFRTF